MVDYSKWDELAASIGEDYEKEDEEGKRQWLSKWEIDNAQLQREWLGNDKAAEQQAQAQQFQEVEGLLRSGKPALSVSESKRVADFLARQKDVMILCGSRQ